MIKIKNKQAFFIYILFNFECVVFLVPLRLLAPWDKYLLFNKNLPPLTIQRGEGACTGFVRLPPDFIIIFFKESRDGVALRNGFGFLSVQAFKLVDVFSFTSFRNFGRFSRTVFLLIVFFRSQDFHLLHGCLQFGHPRFHGVEFS